MREEKVLVSVCTCVQMPVEVKWNQITPFILLFLGGYTLNRIMDNCDMGL